MHADALFTWATLVSFLFTLARVSCVFAFVPLSAFRGTADVAKVFLALAFTVLLWPQWKGLVSPDLRTGHLLAGLASEAALGLATGVVLSLVLEVFQMAAQMVSLQAGFGFASTIDPNGGADSTVLLSAAQITTGLLFFATGADRLLVRALADSLRLCPPGSFVIQKSWAEALIRFGALLFSTGLRLAAPVLALLLLCDATLAVLGRVQTQLQLVSLTIPVKLAASLLLLAATLVYQPKIFTSLMADAIRLIEGMLRSGQQFHGG